MQNKDRVGSRRRGRGGRKEVEEGGRRGTEVEEMEEKVELSMMKPYRLL